MLWTIQELVSVMEATPFTRDGTLPEGVSGLSIDTRTLRPGEAYFAIKGDVHDGHDFVDRAHEAGAALAVVSRERAATAGSMPVLIVDDVLEALCRLARASRARTRAFVVAVTGSVGKTTTKEILRGVLGTAGTVHAAVASFNNHWGVPLTLARMPAEADFAVIEIGMNHPGEITPLVAMARPHVAVVTAIAPAHLGAFASVDEIALAKAEIFSGLEPGGVALLPGDDPREPILRAEAERHGVARIATFGQGVHGPADFRLADYRPRLGTARFAVPGWSGEVRMGAPGHHIAMNAAAALGVAFLATAAPGPAAAALERFEAGKGRGERHLLAHPDGPVLLIDESYNANQASMAAAIRMFAERPPEAGRRVAVLGDMLELGRFSRQQHRSLAPVLRRNRVDAAYLVGAEMKALADALAEGSAADATGGAAEHPIAVRWFATTPELATIIADEVRGHDAVVVKSSLGLGFAAVVDALRAVYPPVEPAA